MATPRHWTRARLDAQPRQLLSRGSRWKPAVWRLEGDPPAILKDVRTLSAWTRPVARWLLRRERRALARLTGLDGFPQLLAIVDRDAFIQTLLPGRPMGPEAFVDAPRARANRMRALVDLMHQRRVYHLDLRQRQNVLWHGTDAVEILDFGAAFAPGPIGAFLGGWLWRWIDRQAVGKYLIRHAPQELSPAEAKAVLRALFWRRLWLLSPHQDRGERAAARARARGEEVDAPE